MCLTTFDKQKRIADKDIMVYKCLQFTFKSKSIGQMDYSIYSPYYNKEWLFNTIYTDKIKKPTGYKTEVEKGLHSATTIRRAKNHGGHIFTAIIPKGTAYYKGNNNDLVSEALVIKYDLPCWRYGKKFENVHELMLNSHKVKYRL